MNRGRGRPRKYPQLAAPGTVRAAHPFRPITEGEATPEQLAEIAAMIRNRARERWPVSVPFTLRPAMSPDDAQRLRPPSEELAQWLNAAADALDKADLGRCAWYLVNALRAVELDCANEWAELASIGSSKLKADTKRGPKRRS